MSNILMEIRKKSGVKQKSQTPALLITQLMALGYSFDEVYPYIYDKPKAGYTDASRIFAAEKEFRKIPWFAKTIELMRETMTAYSVEDAERNVKATGERSSTMRAANSVDFTKKENIIQALSEEAKNLKGKERVDALIKLADLQRMKQEEIKEEKRQTMFYLPLSNCGQCPCYELAKQVHPDLELVDNRPAKIK